MIESKRLLLRPWKDDDIDEIIEGLNDFETVKNLTTPFPYLKEHALDFLAKTKTEKDRQHFAITLKDSKKVIGGTVIIQVDGKIKGGIWIDRRFTGKGYGTEAFTARAKYIFENMNVDEIENGFFDFNERSWKMQQKIGYEIVGQKKNFCPALKKEVTEIVTKLKKENFKY